MMRSYSLIRHARHLKPNRNYITKSLSSRSTKNLAVPALYQSMSRLPEANIHTSVFKYADHTPPTEELLTQLSDIEYMEISDETLESLTEKFDELAESDFSSDELDVQYSSGVLTVKLGAGLGTYVINKQTPNKQIWLSSPTSGPKRYDFIDNQWIYKHEQRSLHDLLTEELTAAFSQTIDFSQCSYSGKKDT